jgi:hypothetical protein
MNLNTFIRIAGCCAAFMSVADAAQAATPSGCISTQGSAVLNATSTLVVDIGGTTPCTQFNAYNYGQNLTINGAKLKIVLVNGTTYTPVAGQSFPILSWATHSGTFSSIDTSQAVLPAGLSWDFSGLYGVSGGVVAVSAPVAAGATQVPVPAWALVALGLGLLGIGKRFGRHLPTDV